MNLVRCVRSYRVMDHGGLGFWTPFNRVHWVSAAVEVHSAVVFRGVCGDTRGEEADEVQVLSTRQVPPVEVVSGSGSATGTGHLPGGLRLPVAVVHGGPGHPEPRAPHQVPEGDAISYLKGAPSGT
ncbi:hypothetical protein EYF80_050516 [Liparis tanakae]|uniref:Uncharacterized protein n=1 Tax=Liparis tanakae TaxID=230148 RepID=A0A4Z2FEA4_9TELE|nr:hypothetical protein EYF80_050516 [Liparis tanakae]